MTDWTPPQEASELRELERERGRAGAPSQGWYLAAFAAGVVLVCTLGFSTDWFDSGPTNLDVSEAYRGGFDEGVAEAEAYWEEELGDRWWAGYKRGQESERSMAPVIESAVRDGFSWEAGYEAGLASPDIDAAQRYLDGFVAGYRSAWFDVTGESIDIRTARQRGGNSIILLSRRQEGADP